MARESERDYDKRRDRDYDRSRDQNRERDRSRDRDKSRDRERDRSKDREQERSRERDRSKDQDRERARSRDRDYDRPRDNYDGRSRHYNDDNRIIKDFERRRKQREEIGARGVAEIWGKEPKEPVLQLKKKKKLKKKAKKRSRSDSESDQSRKNDKSSKKSSKKKKKKDSKKRRKRSESVSSSASASSNSTDDERLNADLLKREEEQNLVDFTKMDIDVDNLDEGERRFIELMKEKQKLKNTVKEQGDQDASEIQLDAKDFGKALLPGTFVILFKKIILVKKFLF